MPRIVEKTVYKFDELNDRAKETARDWFRLATAQDRDWSEHVIEDFATIAGFCGWDIRTRPVKLMNGTTRYEPCVFFSGFSSQGDGACFEGTFDSAKIDMRALRKHAPQDAILHRIATSFARIKRASRRRPFTASVKHRGHYQHEGGTEFDADDASTENREELIEASRDLMRWVYRALEAEWEYQSADEQVDESIRANEYEFTDTGARAV